MKNLQLKSTLPAIALSLLTLAATGQAAVITSNPNLPPVTGSYVSSPLTHLIFNDGGNTYDFSQFGTSGVSAFPNQTQGADEIETFSLVMDQLLSINGGGAAPLSEPGSAQTKTFGKIGNVTGTFNAEMLQLSLAGGTLPPGMMFRESPTLQSLGVTTITNIGGGLYRIDSYFDLFLQLTLDGGQNWIPEASNVGKRIDLVPEPTGLSLLAAGLVGLLGFARRHRAAVA